MSTNEDIVSVPTLVKQSRLYQAFQTLPDTVNRAAETARLTAFERRLSSVTQQSWLYRWLTKEPEPDVIIIDLQETWTVGPIISILDRVIELLAVSYRDSHLERFNTAVQSWLYHAPVQFVSALLLAILVPATIFYAFQTGLSPTTIVIFVLSLGSGAGTFVSLSWPELRETRLVQILITVFEPPEPPES